MANKTVQCAGYSPCWETRQPICTENLGLFPTNNFNLKGRFCWRSWPWTSETNNTGTNIGVSLLPGCTLLRISAPLLPSFLQMFSPLTAGHGLEGRRNIVSTSAYSRTSESSSNALHGHSTVGAKAPNSPAQERPSRRRRRCSRGPNTHQFLANAFLIRRGCGNCFHCLGLERHWI